MPTEKMGSRALPQPPDIDVRIVVLTVAGFIGFVAIIMTALLLYLRADAPRALRSPAERPFPHPALQTSPHGDLMAFERQQRGELARYAWVDHERGLASIPIADAMRIVAARGARGYDPPEQPAAPSPVKQGGSP